MAGIYIHIPFCKSRCIYCGFYSTTLLERRDPYIESLCREMELRSEVWSPRSFSTVYLGGGTPSQLTLSQLEKLFRHLLYIYKVEENAEVTIECNPDDITQEFADGLRALPVNRVSMGVQTFNDTRLRFLCRRHTSSQVTTAVKRLREAGIDNLSIDLMFGFPNETLADWEEDLSKAVALQVEHLSAYSLMYEEGTPLYNIIRCRSKDEMEKEEELSVHMYDMLIDKLEAAGYEHYEISNFAKSDPRRCFRSRHNGSYWQGEPYLGLGAAAHSYDINTRQWNVSDIQQYMDGILRGEVPAEKEVLTDELRYNDTVTTVLRTRKGIPLDILSGKYQTYLLRQARKHIDQGLLAIDDGHIALTRKGLFVSDSIMSDLMYV